MTAFESYGKPWSYRGHVCNIDRVLEDNIIEYFADVRTPSGDVRSCGLGRRDSGSPEMIELWIDAGLPTRPRGQVGPLSKEQLLSMIGDKQ